MLGLVVSCFTSGGGRQQVVEVEQPGPSSALGLLVGGVGLGHRLRPPRRLATRGGGGLGVALGRDHPGPGPVDLGGQPGGGLPAVAGPQLGQESGPALEDLRRSTASVGPVPAELGQGRGVEGARPLGGSRSPSRRSWARGSPAARRVKVRVSTRRGSECCDSFWSVPLPLRLLFLWTSSGSAVAISAFVGVDDMAVGYLVVQCLPLFISPWPQMIEHKHQKR